MESLYDEIERVKNTPYDFLLITSIQKQPGENNYSASGIHLFKNKVTGLVEGELYLYEMGKLYPGTFNLPKGEVYDPPDGIKQCANLFNDGEIRRAKREAEKAEKLSNKDRFGYYNEVYEYFEKWYHENVPDPSEPDRPGRERKTKKQEYEELFNRFYSDPNADPGEVKKALYDDPYWKAPSQYLSLNRRRKILSVADLKSHSGFSWIDPKGTAKD